jgi:hypothetical protein
MLGAFGAHGLKKHITDPNKLANWSTAAHYQVVRSQPQPLQNSAQNRITDDEP